MDYSGVDFTLIPNEEYVKDILSAELGGIGFESFVSNDKGLTAYCPINIFDEQILQNSLASFPIDAEISYTTEVIKAQNWNEVWEKNYFEPIIIDNCIIRSSFHTVDKHYKYEILIDPRMSFGTGHHETTSLMIAEMLKMDLSNKSLLDMGCGTAVLAILATMKGAKPVLGIDIDEWAYSNSLDNIELNKQNDIDIKMGGAELLQGLKFDVIFANINRNILLNDMHTYTACLSAKGELYMSGFYKDDIPVIEAKAKEFGMSLVSFEEKNNWVAVKMIID